MPETIRRSWLLTPVSDTEAMGRAHLSGADVVLLDLVEFVAEGDKPAARNAVQDAIQSVAAGGAEVFVQVDPELLYADLRAAVHPGLTGVTVARLESPDQIVEAHELIGQLEEERGLLPGSLEIVAALETARGNHQAYDICVASQRVTGATLGRAELVMDLRPEPSGEIHLMQYLMQRLVVVANAAGVTPYGAWWRAPDRGLLATPENTLEAATRGRSIGFKGSFCVRENQVASLNQGFTPSQEELNDAGGLLKVYSDGLDRGVAVVQQGGRIIDAGAASQARQLLELAAATAAREERARAALEQRPVPSP